MKKNNYLSKQKGFTLIELLIVILVIGALSGLMLTVVNSGGIRAKSRDSQRIADLSRIQTALELYFADNREYPISGTSAPGNGSWQAINGNGALEALIEPDYLNEMPFDPRLDPSPVADPCTDIENYRYNYLTTANGSAYILTAIMEIPTSADDSLCVDLNNIANGTFAACGTAETATVCYGVENP